jgi:pyruvate/2-oxoglutarate dehydrogenase complex dihydrolipoamide acyltransferase (E2) component
MTTNYPPPPPYPVNYPPPPQQPQQAPRRPWFKKKRFLIPGAFILLFIIIGISNGGNGGSATTTALPTTSATAPAAPAPAAAPALAPAPAAPPAAPPASDTDKITYEVTGSGVSKANNITYVKDKNFGQQQENSAKLPWSKSVEFPNGMFDVQPLSLVAQSGSGGSGSITCRILKNGTEVTSSTSSGPYAVVTCSGGM